MGDHYEIMSGGRCREEHAPAVDMDRYTPLPFSPRATALMTTGHISTHGNPRYRKNRISGAREPYEVATFKSPVQAWHWSFDSTVLHRRDKRHLSSCPGGQAFPPWTAHVRTPRSPPKPVYLD